MVFRQTIVLEGMGMKSPKLITIPTCNQSGDVVWDMCSIEVWGDHSECMIARFTCILICILVHLNYHNIIFDRIKSLCYHIFYFIRLHPIRCLLMLYSTKNKESSPFSSFFVLSHRTSYWISLFFQGRSRLLANSARDAECLGRRWCVKMAMNFELEGQNAPCKLGI